MVGGLLLGVIEALGAAYISIAWKDAIAFCVLILILIVRPTGLLGERVAEKYEKHHHLFWSLRPGLGLCSVWSQRVLVDVLNNVGLYAILALSLNVILGHAGLFHMGTRHFTPLARIRRPF